MNQAKDVVPEDPITVSGLGPKKTGRIVVAHISDLHLDLGTQTSRGRWKSLQDSLASGKDKIDLLVVSGDLIEQPWAKGNVKQACSEAARYLTDLCRAAEISPDTSLLVVPGNHDVRYKGSGRFRPSALVDFRKALKKWTSPHRFFPNLGLCVFLFDSNPPGKWLKVPDVAAGYVQPDELVEHAKTARDLADEFRVEWLEATRVAVLHHHPMPIAGTEQNPNKVLGGEPYMLLKNSGVFMEEVVRSGVDLILHGHKHYPAVSRVAFYVEGRLDRPVPVLGAGSVGKDDDHPLSYNTLILQGSGEVELQRFRRTRPSYEKEFGKPLVLVTYKEARRRRIERLARRSQASLRIQKYKCHHQLQPGSGDVTIFYRVKEATSFSEDPVESVERSFHSKTGYFHEPRFTATDPDQDVDFEWRESPAGDKATGRILYRPAIGRKRGVTYSGEVEINNAVHFNRQERHDATDRRIDRESATYASMNVLGHLVISVTFPENHFPTEGFRVEAFNLLGDEPELDRRESEHARPFLTTIPVTRTAALSLPDPLPGYQYEVSWDLPETESDEEEFEGADIQYAEGFRQRLREVHSGALRDRTEQCLGVLTRDISNMSLGRTQPPTQEEQDSVDAALFVYEREAGALKLAVGTAGVHADLVDEEIKSGRTIVGQAYRRRNAVFSAQPEKEPYFNSTEDPAVLHQGSAMCFAMPLTHDPKPYDRKKRSSGLRVAVFWLRTTSRSSPLIRVADDRAAQCAIIEHVAAWHLNQLRSALKLPAPD